MPRAPTRVTDRMSAVHSGGGAPTTWDDVAVGTSWELDEAYPQSTAVSGPGSNHRSGRLRLLERKHRRPRQWHRPAVRHQLQYVCRSHAASEQSDNVEGLPLPPNGSRPGNSSAERELHAPEANGAFSMRRSLGIQGGRSPLRNAAQCRHCSLEWFSLYEGDNERLMFGVLFAQNSANNRRELGIHNLSARTSGAHTGIAPVAGTKHPYHRQSGLHDRLCLAVCQSEPDRRRSRMALCNAGLHERAFRTAFRLWRRFADLRAIN